MMPLDAGSWWQPIAAFGGIGTFIAGVVAVVTVIRKQRTEHIDVVCARMTRAFETAFEGKIIVNREMSILSANRQARAITGFGQDLIGRTIYDILPKRFHEDHRKHVQRYINDPLPRKMGKIQMKLFLVDRSGVEKEMLLSLAPAENEFGEIEITVGMQVVQE